MGEEVAPYTMALEQPASEPEPNRTSEHTGPHFPPHADARLRVRRASGDDLQSNNSESLCDSYKKSTHFVTMKNLRSENEAPSRS